MTKIPNTGEFVGVRGRLWLVEDCERAENALQPRALSCVDDDASGEQISVLWNVEVGARSREGELCDLIGNAGTDDACVFTAYLRRIRWNSATAAERDLCQAPFRVGIRMDAYQLAPLVYLAGNGHG